MAGWASLLLMLVLSVFLMVPVASAITVDVSRRRGAGGRGRHYPDLPAAERHRGFSTALLDALGFLGVLIGANLLALVLYLFFSPSAPLHLLGG